jgi:hypothetical protein
MRFASGPGVAARCLYIAAESGQLQVKKISVGNGKRPVPASSIY